VKETLARWTVGAALCSSFASPLTAIPHPAHEYFLLSRVAPAAGELPPDGWRQVITGESRRIAADRLGLNR
jgi:hypothetical protein